MATGVGEDSADPIIHAVPCRKPEVQEILDMVRSYGLGPINYDLTEDEILGYGPDGCCD